MGKLESNKLQKRTSLLNTAFNLFTTKGVSNMKIVESRRCFVWLPVFILW